MSLFRRRKRSNHGSMESKRAPTESDFSDLLYEAIPGVKNTSVIYQSIESGKNRGFKDLVDAQRALKDKLKFDRQVVILEDQFNEGGTAAVEAKAKLGKLFINPDNARMLRKLERAVNMKAGALDPPIKARVIADYSHISPMNSDNEANEDSFDSGNSRNGRSAHSVTASAYTPIQTMQRNGSALEREDSQSSYNAFTARFKNSSTSQLRGGSKREARTPQPHYRKNSVSSENSELSINSVRSVRFNGDLGRLSKARTGGDAEYDNEDTQSLHGGYGRYSGHQRRNRTQSHQIHSGYKARAGTVEYFEKQLESSINDSGYTDEDMILLLKDAKKFRTVEWLTVNSMFVKLACDELFNTDIKVVAAVGYPFGTANTAAKVAEAKQACKDGASRIKLMVAAGKVISEDWDYILRETRLVLKHCNHVGIRVVYPTNRRITPKLRKKFDSKLYEMISKQLKENKESKKHHTSDSDNENASDQDADLSLSGLRKQRLSGKYSNRNHDDYVENNDYFDESEENEDYEEKRKRTSTDAHDRNDRKSRNNRNRNDRKDRDQRRHKTTKSDLYSARPQSAKPNQSSHSQQTWRDSKYSGYSQTKPNMSQNNKKKSFEIEAWDSDSDGSTDGGLSSPPKPENNRNNNKSSRKPNPEINTKNSNRSNKSNNSLTSPASRHSPSNVDYTPSPTSSLRLQKIHSNRELGPEIDENDNNIMNNNSNNSNRSNGSSNSKNNRNKDHKRKDSSSSTGRDRKSRDRNGSNTSNNSSGSNRRNGKNTKNQTEIKSLKGGHNRSDSSKSSNSRYNRSKSTKNSESSSKRFNFKNDGNGGHSKHQRKSSKTQKRQTNASSRVSPRLSITESVNSDDAMVAITPKPEENNKNNKNNSKNNSKNRKTGSRDSNNTNSNSNSNRKNKYTSKSSKNNKNDKNGRNGGARDRTTSNQWLKDGSNMPAYASIDHGTNENGAASDYDMEEFMSEFITNTKPVGNPKGSKSPKTPASPKQQSKNSRRPKNRSKR